MLQRFLPLWLLLLCGLALWWPEVTTSFDPFLGFAGLHSQILGIVFALAMFAIGTLLPKEEITLIARKWPRVFLGTLAQYSVMPLLGWALAAALDVSPGIKIGFILAGSVPGAMASNILTLQARGNVSYSVSLTTASTLLSPLVVPIVLSLSLSSVISVEDMDLKKYFDPVSTGWNLAWTVAIPVVCGHLASRFSEAVQVSAKQFSEPAANLIILWIIAVIVAKTRNNFEFSGIVIGGLLTLNLVGYSAGYGIGRLAGLDEPMRRALVLEVGMQNAGLGSLLAVNLFPDHPDAAIPTVLYMFGCMLSGAILAQIWHRRDPEKELEISGTMR
jgi:BASS family bile acid:Na+ symporter